MTQLFLTIFDKKLKFYGNISSINDPLSHFAFREVRKGNWNWILEKEMKFIEYEIKGIAKMNFMNGWIKCFISEGDIVNNPNFKMLIHFNEIEREISGFLFDHTVVTKGNIQFRINFLNNTIELNE